MLKERDLGHFSTSAMESYSLRLNLFGAAELYVAWKTPHSTVTGVVIIIQTSSKIHWMLWWRMEATTLSSRMKNTSKMVAFGTIFPSLTLCTQMSLCSPTMKIQCTFQKVLRWKSGMVRIWKTGATLTTVAGCVSTSMLIFSDLKNG